MLLIGVLPFANPRLFRHICHVCCVLPRKYGPVGVLKRKLYVTSGFPSPFRPMWMLYLAPGENVWEARPAAGSSPGMQFATMVRVLGLSGLRNAYRSVLSAVGSSEISGASRGLHAVLQPGAGRGAE